MNEFIAGLVGGSSGIIVGHPLDTVKALMQTKSHYGMLSTAKVLFNETKVTGFFRGLSIPLASYGFLNSILFGIYGNMLKVLEGDYTDTPKMGSVAIAGLLAGFVTSIPNNPLEVVKLQLQTHDSKEIKGVYSCCQQIMKTDGPKGFFKGVTLLVCRDTPSYSLYFIIFELFRKMAKERGMSNELFLNLVGGGLAGSISWLSIMPFDVVKSRIQSNYSQNESIRDILKDLKNEYGYRGYFKGLTPVLIRGFIVNAVTFAGYKRTLVYLQNGNVLST